MFYQGEILASDWSKKDNSGMTRYISKKSGKFLFSKSIIYKQNNYFDMFNYMSMSNIEYVMTKLHIVKLFFLQLFCECNVCTAAPEAVIVTEN